MWLNTTGEIFSILSFLHFRRQVWVWDWCRGRWCRCLLVQVATFIFDHIVLVDQDSQRWIFYCDPQRWQEDQRGGRARWDCCRWKDKETDFQGWQNFFGDGDDNLFPDHIIIIIIIIITITITDQDTHLEDAGEISCKTNKDSSSCQLKVACEFK